MVENRLICTANEDLISTNNRNILIGDWCLMDDDFKKKIMSLDFEICDYHYDNNQNSWQHFLLRHGHKMVLNEKIYKYHFSLFKNIRIFY